MCRCEKSHGEARGQRPDGVSRTGPEIAAIRARGELHDGPRLQIKSGSSQAHSVTRIRCMTVRLFNLIGHDSVVDVDLSVVEDGHLTSRHLRRSPANGPRPIIITHHENKSKSWPSTRIKPVLRRVETSKPREYS